jgi:DNA replication protein DnaC
MSADPLAMLLRSFKLPTMAARYSETLASAEEQSWGYRRFLQQLCEAEAADRQERKRERLLKQSGLPAGKTFGTLDESKLPVKIRRQLPTLLDGGFIERAENLIAFGLPGRGKTHCLAALGRELILRHGYAVLFIPTYKLVQQLLAAKAALRLEAMLKKLDHYAVVALDDLGYERRSVMISSNLVFSKWDQIFKDPMTTMAAVDRLVHHAVILEFDNESVRATQAKSKAAGKSAA